MNPSLYIALRYYRGRKRKNLIQRIGRIASLGVAVCAAALVVLLSVFNGFESLLIDRFDQVDADLVITPATGKSLNLADFPFEALRQVDPEALHSVFLEEKAVLRYRDREFVVILRGVDSSYSQVTRIDAVVQDGSLQSGLQEEGAIFGQGVAYYLGVTPEVSGAVEVYIPTTSFQQGLQAGSGFHVGRLWPRDVFAVQADYDAEWVLTSFEYMQRLLERDDASGLCIRTQQLNSEVWRQALGSDYAVVNRYEQHEFIYRIMRTEKAAVFALFGFIILIASFNFVGSLIMMIIDKRRDLFVLWSMGATLPKLRAVYAYQSALINATGGAIGVMLGALATWGQDTFGWITLGDDGAFIVQAYPVLLKWVDVGGVFLLVFATGFISAMLPLIRLNEPFVQQSNHA